MAVTPVLFTLIGTGACAIFMVGVAMWDLVDHIRHLRRMRAYRGY